MSETLPAVVIDENINFGAPTDRASRIRLGVLMWAFRAGDSVQAIAEWYECPVSSVENAIRYFLPTFEEEGKEA